MSDDDENNDGSRVSFSTVSFVPFDENGEMADSTAILGAGDSNLPRELLRRKRSTAAFVFFTGLCEDLSLSEDRATWTFRVFSKPFLVGNVSSAGLLLRLDVRCLLEDDDEEPKNERLDPMGFAGFDRDG